jgi:hypothetical protein
MGWSERQFRLVLPYRRKVALEMACMAPVAARGKLYQLQFSQFSKEVRGIALSHS